MNLKDLNIGGRQLFGFVLPGLIALCAVLYALGINVLGFVEDKVVVVRIGIILIAAYPIGFVIQLLSRQFLVKSVERGIARERAAVLDMSDDSRKQFLDPLPGTRLDQRHANRRTLFYNAAVIEPLVLDLVARRLPMQDSRAFLRGYGLTRFLKRYVLECTQELKSEVKEREYEVNLVGGLMGCIVIAAGATLWAVVPTSSWLLAFAIVPVSVIMILYLRYRLIGFLIAEECEWYDAFLVLQAVEFGQKPLGAQIASLDDVQ